MFKQSTTKDVFDRLDDADQDDEPADAEPESAPERDGTESDAPEPGDEPAREDHAPGDQTPTQSRRRRLIRRCLGVALVVVFVAALGLSGFLGWQLKQRADTAAASTAALAAARSYAVTLSSIDTKDIDQNFALVLDGATGEFKDMYSQSAAQLRQLLIDNKAVSKGTVVDAAVKSAAKTNVVVLLFVDQSISNAVNPEPRIDRMRIQMTMELVDNHWLASKVEIS